MLSPRGLSATFSLLFWTLSSGQEREVTLQVSSTVYRKHLACLADVRDTAGRITQIKLIPSTGDPERLKQVMILFYWDRQNTRQHKSGEIHHLSPHGLK